MEGRLNEDIGMGRLVEACDLLDVTDSVGRDLGDVVLACIDDKDIAQLNTHHSGIGA